MTRVFLLGGRGGGGEEVFVRELADTPPPGVSYSFALDHKESAPGAPALGGTEVLLNRLVHPVLWPLPGFRAYRVDPEIALVHTHNFPIWLRARPRRPVVMSVGGAGYPHYLETYLGWGRDQIEARYRRAGRVYGALGIRSEVPSRSMVDAIAVFSPFAADRLMGIGVPSGRLHVVPPGFSIPRPARSERREGPFTFVLVGRDPERKGVDLALGALRRVRAQGHEARLLLVGDPLYPTLTSSDGVEGFGPVDRATVFGDFYGRADAVLVPSRAEGFGFAAVEGMGHALPVVASRRDTLPWIVGDGGILVEPGDEASLASAMATLTTDPEGSRALGTAGRRRFEDVFTMDRVRGLLGALYDRLLEAGR